MLNLHVASVCMYPIYQHELLKSLQSTAQFGFHQGISVDLRVKVTLPTNTTKILVVYPRCSLFWGVLEIK